MESPLSLYDTASVRAVEARAIAAAGAGVLMSRAGQAAWRLLLREWPDAMRIVVVCAPGNNGGDGAVVARLAHESGRDVQMVVLGAVEALQGDAAAAMRGYRDAGGRLSMFDGTLPRADVIVDALFGIGLSRALEGDAAVLVDSINAQTVPVLSLDVPSGVDAETGAVRGAAVDATRTLQFIAAHRGLFSGAACDHVGERETATLDVPPETFDGVEAAVLLVNAGIARRRLPARRRNSHKGLFGHLLCIGGSPGMGGAIVLCAGAALRTGAGLVSVATNAAHVPVLLSRWPECMAHGGEDVSALAPLIARATAIAIGPGLGTGPHSRELLDAALAAGKPMVLDADALNLIAGVAGATAALPAGCVVTPHPGEAARLLAIDVATLQADRFRHAQALADRLQCAVVLKGCGSIVCAPGDIPRVIDGGNPGMASGGMGDVLTGVVGALLAQRLRAFDAAWIGAALHAAAGDLASQAIGEYGLLASDLIARLPAVIRGGPTV